MPKAAKAQLKLRSSSYTDAAGRVLRVQGLPFQDRCLSAALKRGCFQKKAFLFSSKKRSARVTCNGSGREHQVDAAA
jgi:hypothetical protein